MRLLSRRAKESIKTALAMVLAFAIALSWDWMNPYWAGFAVALISLPTAGQSLQKGAMRMFGTLVAVAAALTLISLEPQARWLFLACASAFVSVCAYMITSGKHQYFWYVSGFVTLIICVDAGPNAKDAFDIAVTRTLETGLGILVYSMVSIFLWPQSSAAQLEETARGLSLAQQKRYQSYRNAAARNASATVVPQIQAQEIQLLGRLSQLLNAAASESYEVRERRGDWLRLHEESAAILQTFDYWRESIPEIGHLDLSRFFPNIEEIFQNIEATFDEIELAWSGTNSTDETLDVTLEVDRAELIQLSHLERAALILTKTNLTRLAAHAKEVLRSVRALKGFVRPVGGQTGLGLTPQVSPIDPDRLAATARVAVTLWIAFLVWVYIDPPGHAAFVQFTGSVALALVMMPQGRPSMLFLPITLGSTFAGVIYIFIMPRLSSYFELAPVLFAAVFMISFVFSEPRQGLSRSLGMVTLLILTSIQNQQSYSFSGFANSTAMLLLGTALLTVISYVPYSPRPEKQFSRLISHYAHCGAFFLDQLEEAKRRRWRSWDKWKADYYRGSLRRLPAKLSQVSQGIDFKSLPPNNRDQVQALLASIHALSIRLLALEEAHRQARTASPIKSLRVDVDIWRRSLVKLLHEFGDNKIVDTGDNLKNQLELTLARIEARTEEGIKSFDGQRSNDQTYLNAYSLLGSYRGLSEAVVAYAKISNGIDWSRWNEARF